MRLILCSNYDFCANFYTDFQFIHIGNIAKIVQNVCRLYTLKSFSPNRHFGKKSAFASALKIKMLQNTVKMLKK